MATYGYSRTSASFPDSDVTGSGAATLHVSNARCNVFNPATSNAWGYRWNGHLGKRDSNVPTVQGAVQSVTPGNNPTASSP